MRVRSWLRPVSAFSAFSFAVLTACSGASPKGGDDPDTGGSGDETGGGTDSTVDETSPSDSGVGDGSGDDTTDTAIDDTGPTPDTAPREAGDGGIIPGCGEDSDGDGITDSIEGRFATGGATDTDTDGTPDYLDHDSDDDKIPDVVEWLIPGCDAPFAELNDADGDGVPNFQDLDSDGNGFPDKGEACPPVTMPGAPAGCTAAVPADFDGDGIPDWVDFDNDHDSSSTSKTLGLEDKYELTDITGKYVGLIDSDGDKIFDVYDRDSDNDFILDLDDGITDPNKNSLANFRDKDSDGDNVADACEARASATPGPGDYTKALLDTNKNGIFDYLDKDSDGDLLVDGSEDTNGNCLVEASETDRVKADTDGDGISDMVEVALGTVTCAKDPTCTPGKLGKFYFIVPYSTDGSIAPSPASSTLALSTTLNKGDVGFIVDTTGSMAGEIANLKSSLSSSIIPALKAKIPSLGIGVAAHDDFPYGTFGSAGDQPYYNTSPSGFVTTDTTAAQNAANSLGTHGGYDGPESQIPALVHAIHGDALNWPTGSVPADTGSAGATFGGLHFRTDAFPILIEISDADFHNGRSVATGGILNAYSFSTVNTDNLVADLNAVGAKFIGVAADNGGRAGGGPGGTPYNYMAYITDNTSSNVAPSAFGGSCKTGVGGAAIAADGPGGLCRSVFSISTSGTGLGTSIVDGVYAILASIKFDVHVEAYNDASAAPVDVVTDFMTKVEPMPTGGTDPMTGASCVTFPASQLADNFHTPKAVAGAGDILETIKQVNPGAYYCFNVVPKANTIIPATTKVQTFTAWLRVIATKPTGGTFILGADRQVLFLIPPVIN